MFKLSGPVNGMARLHVRGCHAAQPIKNRQNVLDPVEQGDVDDLNEREYPVKFCKCVPKEMRP